MALSSDSPFADRAPTAATTTMTPNDEPTTAPNTNEDPTNGDTMNGGVMHPTPAKTSIDTAQSTPLHDDLSESPIDFTGELNTNNEIPTQDTLRKIEDFTVLDKDGKTVPFRNIYSGPNVTRRVLVIFIRHFFCGNCQEYIRTLTKSITPSSLLHLATPTFIAIIGCGSPHLIPMYATETSCPFPIYADPTKKLYSSLGMLRTLHLGARPEYQRRGTLLGMLQSVKQGFVALKGGNPLKAVDMHQVGGEFLFEPVNDATPICSPSDETADKELGNGGEGRLGEGKGERGEEKRVTWCHRMRNTRDHAEIPELREVLGLDGEGVPGNDRKRWMRAVKERKGTGLSTRTSGSMDGKNSGRESSEKASVVPA